MIVDYSRPLASRWGHVNKDHFSRSLGFVHHLGKFFDKSFESVDFKRGTHDDQEVGFACKVGRLDRCDVISERMRFVVQNNGRS